MAQKAREDDTIAAISTPMGFSGIGIVRMSGKDALRIGEEMFSGSSRISEKKGYSVHYGFIKDGDEILDEVLCIVMKAPKSYTREDVVEFHCHGGPIILHRVLEAVLKRGARLAEPGEFTKRAFLNQRIDLSQAEAVIGLIQSQTEASARASLRALRGEFGKDIKKIQKVLMELIAELEAGLDFADEDIEFISLEEVNEKLDEIGKRLKELIERAKQGRVLSEGVKVAIVGRPNVGKSTLMNLLLERERVIVAPEPGTTRDVIEEPLNIYGIPVRLIDTAGIRFSSNYVEREGVSRTRKAIEESDLILVLLDSSQELMDEDYIILEEIKERNWICVLNKTDLPQKINLKEIDKYTKEKPIKISALYGTGLENLKQKLKDTIMGGQVETEGAIMASLRQLELLVEAGKDIERAREAIENNLGEEFIVSELRRSLESLRGLSGENITDEVLDIIFSKFCIGK